MDQIRVDLDRKLASIDRNIFGGFAEHLGRCIYGGIYEPDSPLADEDGIRADVLDALCRLRMPILRYPGGNFVSGYRWRDGIGPADERPVRADLAWNSIESNQFGTNEFIQLCRKLETEPYLTVNCGDGDLREARDWVEYCNGTQDTSLVKLRRQHGFDAPHNVKYWGIGNEVDGHWQIGAKTPEEYARAYLEFAKVMKWVDPTIKLTAAVTSDWSGDIVARAGLLVEQAGRLIDYLGIHWYVGNPTNNFEAYMAVSELIEERLSAYDGLIRMLRLQHKLQHPIAIGVDEWNVWYRKRSEAGDFSNTLEEIYNLEDALVVAIQLNAFIRHAASVRMANLAQVVNVIAPIFTNPSGLFLQSIFYPFELYSSTCGTTALDVFWKGDTFSTGAHTGIRTLDVAATLNEDRKQVVLYVVNRSETKAMETAISLPTPPVLPDQLTRMLSMGQTSSRKIRLISPPRWAYPRPT
ncbi:MAG: alpha-L-arabinofuranosidase C-terminal domain-containing protein [Anaerolineae bacterium]